MNDPFDYTIPGYVKHKPGWSIRSGAGTAQKKRIVQVAEENKLLREELTQLHERLMVLESSLSNPTVTDQTTLEVTSETEKTTRRRRKTT